MKLNKGEINMAKDETIQSIAQEFHKSPAFQEILKMRALHKDPKYLAAKRAKKIEDREREKELFLRLQPGEEFQDFSDFKDAIIEDLDGPDAISADYIIVKRRKKDSLTDVFIIDLNGDKVQIANGMKAVSIEGIDRNSNVYSLTTIVEGEIAVSYRILYKEIIDDENKDFRYLTILIQISK